MLSSDDGVRTCDEDELLYYQDALSFDDGERKLIVDESAVLDEDNMMILLF